MAPPITHQLAGLVGADEATQELAVILMLQDIQELRDRSKGKQRSGTFTDPEISMMLFEQELRNMANMASDRRLSHSHQQAVHTDAHAIEAANRQEFMARHDRQVSLAIAHGRPIPPIPAYPRDDEVQATTTPSVPGRSNPTSDRPIKKRKLDTECDISIDHQGMPLRKGETSSWAASRPQPRPQPQPQRPCTSCMDVKPANLLVKAPCSHDYCHECLLRLFRSAMTDESLFPPRCCSTTIPPEDQLQVLGVNLVQKYHEKEEEYSTVNRTYCYESACRVFIPLRYIEGDRALCPSCVHETCIYCKRMAHAGECPHDHELRQVLDVAEAEGWKRCVKCFSMVELEQGCNHITYEFCYVCGAPWKTCKCPVWDEHRLFERGEIIAQRQIPAANARGRMQNRIQEIMANLREGNMCEHRDWRSIPGANHCEGLERLGHHDEGQGDLEDQQEERDDGQLSVSGYRTKVCRVQLGITSNVAPSGTAV
ncbi:hypothetical protein F4778DRAFT_784026 [Xylariomycetidae sp. FL2044]|nr:hypothetical protein F4778DRAFT_784026 [Xylariomycetidae sp. FL2044]